jgi:hypothetical protein
MSPTHPLKRKRSSANPKPHKRTRKTSTSTSFLTLPYELRQEILLLLTYDDSNLQIAKLEGRCGLLLRVSGMKRHLKMIDHMRGIKCWAGDLVIAEPAIRGDVKYVVSKWREGHVRLRKEWEGEIGH